MKTVTARLVSSKPVSLSKGAKILSGFAAVENGASHAISVFLERASDSLNHLVQFHKELKSSPSKHERQKPPLVDDTTENEINAQHVEKSMDENKEDRSLDMKGEAKTTTGQIPDGVREEKRQKKPKKDKIIDKDEDTSLMAKSEDGDCEKKRRKKRGKEKNKDITTGMVDLVHSLHDGPKDELQAPEDVAKLEKSRRENVKIGESVRFDSGSIVEENGDLTKHKHGELDTVEPVEMGPSSREEVDHSKRKDKKKKQSKRSEDGEGVLEENLGVKEDIMKKRKHEEIEAVEKSSLAEKSSKKRRKK